MHREAKKKELDNNRMCSNRNSVRIYGRKIPRQCKQGSGAEDSVGPHSGRPVFLWSNMKIWIVYFHF